MFFDENINVFNTEERYKKCLLGKIGDKISKIY